MGPWMSPDRMNLHALGPGAPAPSTLIVSRWRPAGPRGQALRGRASGAGFGRGASLYGPKAGQFGTGCCFVHASSTAQTGQKPAKTVPKPAPEAWTGNPKHYRCLRNKRPSEPYEFIGFGTIFFAKPCACIWFGGTHGPKSYKLIGFRWALISQTLVLTNLNSIAQSIILGFSVFCFALS